MSTTWAQNCVDDEDCWKGGGGAVGGGGDDKGGWGGAGGASGGGWGEDVEGSGAGGGLSGGADTVTSFNPWERKLFFNLIKSLLSYNASAMNDASLYSSSKTQVCP